MKLNIMGSTWKLFTAKKLMLDDTEVLGYCDFKEREIHVVKDSEYEATLIHEIIHAVLYEIGLTQGLDPNIEEILCDSISRQIYRTFKLKLLL